MDEHKRITAEIQQNSVNLEKNLAEGSTLSAEYLAKVGQNNVDHERIIAEGHRLNAELMASELVAADTADVETVG